MLPGGGSPLPPQDESDSPFKGADIPVASRIAEMEFASGQSEAVARSWAAPRLSEAGLRAGMVGGSEVPQLPTNAA